jgi:hypothetical protein
MHLEEPYNAPRALRMPPHRSHMSVQRHSPLAAVADLCKSMVMHNTKAEDAPGCSLPRYFLVILQVHACVLLNLDVL